MDGLGSRLPADGHVDSFTAKGHGHVPQGAFVVPDANLIFNGEFKREGVDLVLSHDGHEFVVHDYFRGDKRAAIASPDGAHLTGDIVNALTGHVEYAQAAPGVAAAQVIGHVTKLSGSATAVRNGVSIILNNGDNVEKGDVVSTGGDSTLGVTFIDGTVFGLSSNARMLLNEMVYDPNGSNNSSLLSLVAGTITFVAGETAKHGDMKIDTPVATMGIRGTAVLTQINFVVPAGGGDPQPQASFQVLVEPNGTTGSYILFDKLTLLPIATVNQAGQMIQISGGNVSISSALMSPDVQKLITDVFTLKFTDNGTNTKLTSNFTDTITQTVDGLMIKTQAGASATLVFTNLNGPGTQGPDLSPQSSTRIPGPPHSSILDSNGNVTSAFKVPEHANATGDRADTTGDAVPPDIIIFRVNFVDQNLGDRPTVSVDLADAPNYAYMDAGHHDVTNSLTALQKQDIAATLIKINVVADGGNNNNGSALGTYTIPDHAFDFLAAGETLTLTYMVRVDNNFSIDPETATIPITITITGTNDKPVITTSVPTITFSGGTSVPGGPLTSDVPTSGTLKFTDVDLTDKHTVSVNLTSATLPDGTVPDAIQKIFANAMSVGIHTDSTGTGNGVVDWSLADLPVYLADFIPAGEVVTLTYTVTVTDSQGATSDQTITVTITGTDAPAVVWIATSKPGAPSGGFWKDGANWETGAAPTLKDDAIVITDQLHGLTPSYPVTIDAAAYAKSLTMDDYDTKVHHTAPQLINQSTLTIAGTLTLNADARFTNTLGGHVFLGGAIDVETITRKSGLIVTNTSKITNAGTLTLAAGGTIDTLTTISNSGTIDLSGGTLALKSDIANIGGTLQVDAGATLVAGTVTVDGGTVTIAGALELDGNGLIENGTLNNSGMVNVKGAAEFAHETVSNTSSGTIEVLANGWLTIHLASSVTNNGAVTVDASGKLIVNGATIDGAGTVTNNSEIDLTGNAVLSHGILKNNSALNVSGTGNALDGETVTNAGTIEVVALGALAIEGSTVYNSSGSIIVDTNAALTLSGATLSGGAVKGGGSIDVTGDSTIDGQATLSEGIVTVESDVTLALDDATVAGTAITNRGTVAVDASKTLTLNGATIDGGAVTIAGTLESTGTSAISEADITNTGTITVTSGKLTIDPVVSHTLTNSHLVQANGGELDISGELIVNTADIKAIGGGILKLSTLTVTNDGGTVTVDGTSKLYLTDVSINGGSLNNSGNLYGVSGSSTISAAVTNTGTIEVQAGTLDLAGGLTGAGTLIIDDKATLELGGADAQTVTFAGGADTLRLDKVAGHTFTGTITGQATTAGTFTVTGDANITTGKGDALDFTASGGLSGSRGDIVLTPTGTLTGATNGIVVTQNGIGNISLTTVGDVIGLAGDGIVLHDGATGAGDITATIGGAATGAVGLDIVANGAGNVTITNSGHVTGTSSFGISVDQDGAGATGSTHVTNTGSVVGANGIAAISIYENASGTATITNSGTIGPDAALVTSTSYAIFETGGAITINNTGHIDGSISVATATFNNESGGTWTVAGSGVFGDASSIVNHGTIDLHGASISGTGLSLENDSVIDSWGTASISGTVTNTATIEVHTGTLTLVGSLSGTGSVTIDAGATLDVDGTVSQTMSFHGDGAELQIGTTSFGGSVAGFAATDKLDLSTIKFDGGTSATYDDETGDLVVSDAYGHSITVKLVGEDYSNASFAGSSDGHGGTLITLNADDDKPTFIAAETSQSAVLTEQPDLTGATATIDQSTPTGGAIHFTDVDLTDRPTAKVTDQSVTGLDTDGITHLTLTPDEITALENALSLQQTGKNNGTVGWSYSIADSSLDFLGEGQTATVVSTITIEDSHHKTDTAEVTVTITGKNDAPAITTGTNDTASATLTETNAGLSKTGTLTVSDADATDHVTASATDVAIYLDGHLQADGFEGLSAPDLLSYLTVQCGDILNGTATHTQFSWHFNSGEQPFDFLAAGQTLSLQYTIVPNDGHTTGTGEIVTININGSNDAPTLDCTTLASVAGNQSNPGGDTVSDLFAGKFHDVDDGASFKAIAVTSDAATATEGVWQYEIAGTHQWVDIGSVCDTQALVLATDTLIRFVPADGYTGTPDPLGVHALDNTYNGAITTSSASPATIDITAMSTDGTAPVSDKAATIGTSVTAPVGGPVIDTSHLLISYNSEFNTDTLTNLTVSDIDPGAATDTFTVTATTGHSGTSVTPDFASGSLSDINPIFQNGGTYDPGPTPPATEQIVLTVADSEGRYDSIHFIFNKAGDPGKGITLQGTSGKDVIFATTTGDTLTGGGGKDQFVFAPNWTGDDAHHTITDFATGDKIDLRQFSDVSSIYGLTITQQSGDTVVAWQHQIGEGSVTEHEQLLLKNVTAALKASDFIFHVS